MCHTVIVRPFCGGKILIIEFLRISTWKCFEFQFKTDHFKLQLSPVKTERRQNLSETGLKTGAWLWLHVCLFKWRWNSLLKYATCNAGHMAAWFLRCLNRTMLIYSNSTQYKHCSLAQWQKVCYYWLWLDWKCRILYSGRLTEICQN